MKQATRIWYSAGPEGHDSRYSLDLNGTWNLLRLGDLTLAAESAAASWFHDGGYEATWPVELAIYATEDGPELARLDVDMEMEPRFYATQKRSQRSF
jgi:hypothetical protein